MSHPTRSGRRRAIAVIAAVSALLAVGTPVAAADPLSPPAAQDEAGVVLPAPDPEPSPEDVAGIGAVVVEPVLPQPQDEAELRTTAVMRAPVKSLPRTMDAYPGYQSTTSCDPVVRPGVRAFGELLASHYGKTRYYLSRACLKGGSSQHYEGRALDWPLNAYNSGDKALGDSVVSWLAADSGAIAKRFGIMYVIWNEKIWYAHRPGAWESYSGPSPHTDHIHFSFTWDGAMKRTSWWTGAPVSTVDQGTCRRYSGQYAPRYDGRRTTACPTRLPAPPTSPYPVYVPGANHAHIKVAQRALGFSGGDVDGAFGPRTLERLLAYQKRQGLPVTGVLDNVTWIEFDGPAVQTPFGQIVAGPDLTGDGHSDVLTVDRSGRLFLYRGIGSGRVEKARAFGLGWTDLRVYSPGDWDGDGRNDVIVADASGVLWMYPGDGAGGLRTRKQIGHGWTPYRITPAGDMNGDGAPDLMAIDAKQRLFVYPGNGVGGFRSRVQVGHAWGGFQLHAGGDMNRDGNRDILGIDAAGRLWFYAGRGSGYFRTAKQVGHGWTGLTFASGGDFDRDGIGDLLGRDLDHQLRFYGGRTTGSFRGSVVVGTGW